MRAKTAPSSSTSAASIHGGASSFSKNQRLFPVGVAGDLVPVEGHVGVRDSISPSSSSRVRAARRVEVVAALVFNDPVSGRDAFGA